MYLHPFVDRLCVRCWATERLARKLRGRAQLLLNPQQLVVLGKALGATGGACLDLTRAQTDDQVRDERVLCLARPAARVGMMGVSDS